MTGFDRIETTRLIGKRLCDEDFEYLRVMNGDADVMATLGGIRPEEETWELLRAGLAHWEQNGFGSWVFRLRETGEAIGSAGLRQVLIEGRDEVEVGYRVAATWWGRGIATEMASALVVVARDRLRLEEIVAFTVPDNLASRRVMEKAGFRHRSPEQTRRASLKRSRRPM